VNEEKPAEPTVDGMPFDDGPSWQAPREKGISTDVGVALLIVAGIVMLVVLRIVGVI
jgi:hypothetical protein